MENRINDTVMGPMTICAVTRCIDNNTYTFEMFGIDRSGREMKMMEIDYAREQ